MTAVLQADCGRRMGVALGLRADEASEGHAGMVCEGEDSSLWAHRLFDCATLDGGLASRPRRARRRGRHFCVWRY